MSDDPTLRTQLVSLSEQLSRMSQVVSEIAIQDRGINKFLSDNWGPLKADIQDVRNRMENIERSVGSHDFSDFERRLNVLEDQASYAKGVAAVTNKQGAYAGAITGGGVGAAVVVLQQLVQLFSK